MSDYNITPLDDILLKAEGRAQNLRKAEGRRQNFLFFLMPTAFLSTD
jgi:hypothetical protein